MRVLAAFATIVDRQRGALFPWAAVAFGTGIATYFALPVEPGPGHWAGLGLICATLAAVVLRRGLGAPLAVGVVFLLAGVAVAGLRTHGVAAPVLQYRYYGPVEGRVVEIDRSASDRLRITLDRVILERHSGRETPGRVRISLHHDAGLDDIRPGATVMTTAHLSPPRGPVEPGGFDFRRHAWFQGIGAVGYTRVPVMLAGREDGWALWRHRARMAISAHVQKTIGVRAGAFAAAVTTGDRSAMDEATVEALRVSNLAHLLAISGLHMGLLTGFVYAMARYGLALWPRVALNWPIHKLGVVAAIAAGAVYLGLSGGGVATERAFIMVTVMLTAILIDRRALSLRAVALAALVVLAIRPEAITGPGFQMSFAATAALIAVFEAMKRTALWSLHPVLRWGVTLVLSSLVAGLATAPFAAAHFNRLPHYGLIANILAVPVMGSVVIPGAVIAAILAPVGLEIVGLAIMGAGVTWILAVADLIADLPGAWGAVVAPGPVVLPLVAFGGLVLILWQGRGRVAGTLPLVVAAALWASAQRPEVLVASDGALVGVMGAGGRILSKPRGAGFTAEVWLENDGDPVSQEIAAGRGGRADTAGLAVYDLPGGGLVHATGRGAVDKAAPHCGRARLIVVSAEDASDAPCPMIDQAALRATGALAIETGAEWRIRQAETGQRPWGAPGRGQ